MLFEIGKYLSPETSEIIRRNTNIDDRIAVSKLTGISESSLRSIIYGQRPVSELTQASMMIIGQLAFASSRKALKERANDSDFLLEQLEMPEDKIYRSIEEMGFHPIEH